MDISIVEYFSENGGHRCGYCRSHDGSRSHGAWGHVLTCSDYQDLLDRGWRRSGKYCYKPTMDETCCPQYTIRCDALAFRLTRSHKKALKKLANFIIHDKGRPMGVTEDLPCAEPMGRVDSVSSNYDESSDDENDCQESNDAMDVDALAQELAEEVETKVKAKPDLDHIDLGGSSGAAPKDEEVNVTAVEAKRPVMPGSGPDPNKPRARKKKQIRREKAMERLKAAGKEAPVKAKNSSRSLEDLTSIKDRLPEGSKHCFKVRLVRAQTSDDRFMETFAESFAVYKKYQTTVHKDKPESCTSGQFKRFLCNSSLVETGESDLGSVAFGAYHQQYVVDDRIIAVGVVDVLPRCVSSVYLFYDPDYAFLSLGTVTSLFEIDFVRCLQRERHASLRFYYMGFYIHSCPKMRYKARYRPSWLLCPVSFRWVEVEKCFGLLDKSKFARLDARDDRPEPPFDIERVLVLYENRAMDYGLYAKKVVRSSKQPADNDEVAEYAGLVGGRLARKMLLYRH